jgi:hypothetical protein
MIRRLTSFFFFAAILIFFLFNFISCGPHIGQVKISTLDEYKRTYEANEKYILRAVASVLREENMGTNVEIKSNENMVETDYIVQGDWRTKIVAHVKRLNLSECELVLSVITEKKTEKGWEMRRLLKKGQYDTFFDSTELQIYREIAKNYEY